MGRKVITVVLSVLLILGSAPGNVTSGQDSDAPASVQYWKFVINPRTGQILIRDSLNFHDEMALGVGADPGRLGYVAGDVIRKNGKNDIVFRLDTIQDPVLKRRWEGAYLAEYIKTKLCSLNEAKGFHGAEVRVGRNSRGFFDWRAGKGLVAEKPPGLPAAESAANSGRGSQVSGEWKTGSFFSSQPRPAQSISSQPARQETLAFAEMGEEPRPESAALPQPPGPTNPVLEKRIEALLRNTKLEQLQTDIREKRWDFFVNQEFAPPEGSVETARAWKKVCSKSEFRQQSALLAEMRWKMVVDVWAEIALDHQVHIELIDSGSRSAYRSDIDVTVYADPAARGSITLAQLIADFNLRFETRFKYQPANIDITTHDGDVFLPGVRNAAQTFEEYRSSLRGAVKQMRLKVTSGGDAYYVPGANLETVQKRGFRDGRATSLDPRVQVLRTRSVPGEEGSIPASAQLQKPAPIEYRIGELDPNGRWRTNAMQFEGIVPAYDRSNAFGVVTQNLRQMIDHADDRAAFSKYFNRAINEGAGAGLVNSYRDIHACGLPNDQPTTTVDPIGPSNSIIRDAFMLEGLGKADQEARASILRKDEYKIIIGGKMQLMKARWMIRAFRLDIRMSNEAFRNLYQNIEISNRIEYAKANNLLDWEHPDRGRSVFLQPYFDEAVSIVQRSHPELIETSAPVGPYLDAVYSEAWKIHTRRLRDTVGQLLVSKYIEAIRDFSVAGLKHNAYRYMVNADGSVNRGPNVTAARKQAEKIRVEIATMFEIVKKIENPVVSKELTEQILKETPQALKAEVQKLSELTSAELDNFLSEYESRPPQPASSGGTGNSENAVREEALNQKRQRVERLTEVSGQEAERRLRNPQDWQKLKEHIREGASFREPAYASAIRGIVDMMDRDFQLPPKDFGAATWNNLMSPLMLANSALNIVNAYRTGNRAIISEAIITESLFYLPTSYGIVGIAIKDFSRGEIKRGIVSIGMLGLLRYASEWASSRLGTPYVGELLLVYDLSTGVPSLGYHWMMEKIDDDLIEQAFRSRPDPGSVSVRALRNPSADNPIVKADTPGFPIFWGHSCMRAEDENSAFSELTKKGPRMFAPTIWKQLMSEGLTPVSKNWDARKEQLEKKYSFDLPYYQRIAKIYDCFQPLVAAQVNPDYSNEDEVLQQIFNSEVRKWFDSQPDGYKAEFEGLFGGTSRRDQLLASMRQRLIGLYKAYEIEDARVEFLKDDIQKRIAEKAQQWNVLEMQLLLSKDRVLDRIQAGFESWANQQLSQSLASPGRVRLKAPTWYIDFSGYVDSAANDPQDSTERPPSAEPMIDTSDQSSSIPVDIVVEANRADHPQPWTHDYWLKAESVKTGPPAGFVPTEKEKAKLEEKDPQGRPKYTILTLSLQARASALDAAGAVIGTSEPVPVIGYAIAPIPKVSGSAVIVISAEKPGEDGAKIAVPVVCNVQADNSPPVVSMYPLDSPPRTVASFAGLSAGSHAFKVVPQSQDWEAADANCEIVDEYSKVFFEARGSTPPNNFPIVLPVKLKYIGKPPQNDSSQLERTAGGLRSATTPTSSRTDPVAALSDLESQIPNAIAQLLALRQRTVKACQEAIRESQDLNDSIAAMERNLAQLRIQAKQVKQQIDDLAAAGAKSRQELDVLLNESKEHQKQLEIGVTWLRSRQNPCESDGAARQAGDICQRSTANLAGILKHGIEINSKCALLKAIKPALDARRKNVRQYWEMAIRAMSDIANITAVPDLANNYAVTGYNSKESYDRERKALRERLEAIRAGIASRSVPGQEERLKTLQARLEALTDIGECTTEAPSLPALEQSLANRFADVQKTMQQSKDEANQLMDEVNIAASLCETKLGELPDCEVVGALVQRWNTQSAAMLVDVENLCTQVKNCGPRTVLPSPPKAFSLSGGIDAEMKASLQDKVRKTGAALVLEGSNITFSFVPKASNAGSAPGRLEMTPRTITHTWQFTYKTGMIDRRDATCELKEGHYSVLSPDDQAKMIGGWGGALTCRTIVSRDGKVTSDATADAIMMINYEQKSHDWIVILIGVQDGQWRLH